MYSIAIRADGNSKMGMGHIIRCLSLAREFKRKGCLVYFLSKYHEGIKRIRIEGFEAIELQETSENFAVEICTVINIIDKLKSDLLIIDSYNVFLEYFLDIKPHVKKLAYIDDINKFIYPVDILINGNITGEFMDYKKYSENEIMLLGPKYNLIREEFKNLPERKIEKKVKRIMLTTGGSDPYNMTTKMLNMMLADKRSKDLNVDVIIGDAFTNKEQIKKINEQFENIKLFENNTCMSGIMLRSDIAISAGGSTLYELCACGTPTLAFIMAGNQEGIVQKLNESGYIGFLGWYDSFSTEDFIDKLKKLCNDFTLRAGYSDKMQKLVDAKGAERVADVIIKALNSK